MLTALRKTVLSEAFPRVPIDYIETKIRQHGHLYGAHVDIANTERRHNYLSVQPYPRLKLSRLPKEHRLEENLRSTDGRDINKMHGLQAELRAARHRQLRDDGKLHCPDPFSFLSPFKRHHELRFFIHRGL